MKNITLYALCGMILLALAACIFVMTGLHTPDSTVVRETVSAAEQVTLLAQAEKTQISEIQIPTETPAAVSTENPTLEPTRVSPDDYFRSNTSQESYASWIHKLSGEEPVTVNGTETTIKTRYSYAMFSGQTDAQANPFLLQTLQEMLPGIQIENESYQYQDGSGMNTWYNIVVTFPGTVHPDEQILYTAHYDSCVAFEGDPMTYAPGANDNGTGVATLLEALKSFKDMNFEKTLKVIFFSGEENFFQGSKAYIAAHKNDNIKAVVNMDMFGADKDNDRCFEIHCGKLPASDQVGQIFKQALADHQINMTYDYFTYIVRSGKYPLSGDQTSFWDAGIPCIAIMENFSSDNTPGGCQLVEDDTDTWHLPADTYANVNMSYAFDISLSGTYTILNLTGASMK